MRSAVVAAALLAATPSVASAFCGFYVSGSDQKMYNDATQVVLMRQGTRTVLAMQNNYKGPPSAFAMVIPVPVVLHEADVKTLNRDLFAHVDQMGAPRLVEYWEQDPCTFEQNEMREPSVALAEGAAARPPAPMQKDLGVKIEAKFVVGEYQIVILSAKDSTGLDTWLRQEKYQIPQGAEPLLRPYVESGSKFFVAKVDPQKVKFVDGRAALSPLRFHYDSDEFTLPIRLGLANSSGMQDLIVNIFAPNQRYEVANYKNVTIPTNIDVKEVVKDRFASFYASLFDRTIQRNPGAVVTEYAWQATTCDPCPGPTLDPQELATLGGDVLGGTKDQPAAYPGYDFVLTRLHARYGTEIKDDLSFKKAPPIVGGRESVQSNGRLEEGARPDSANNFQGRYAIRHEWTGPIRCEHPHRGEWGGPPIEVASRPGFQPTGINGGARPATDIAFAARNAVELPAVVNRNIPEIGVTAAVAVAAPGTPEYKLRQDKKGCGCQTSNPAGLGLILGVLLWPIARRRPRRSRAR